MALRVLVTGAYGPAGRSMIDALNCESVTLLACDCEPDPEAIDQVPPQRRFVVHRTDDPEFVGDLVTLCVHQRVNVLVPMRDSDRVALTRVRRLFERLGACVWLAPISAQAPGEQARRILRLAERAHAKTAVGDWFRRSRVGTPVIDHAAGIIEPSNPHDVTARAP